MTVLWLPGDGAVAVLVHELGRRGDLGAYPRAVDQAVHRRLAVARGTRSARA
jgi:hypothetical protein